MKRAEALLEQRPALTTTRLERAMADESLTEFGEVVQVPGLDHLHQSGIYFLWHKGEVVYVGQAKNMRTRICDHIGDPLKTFDAVSGFPCSLGRLGEMERHYIERLVPKYNRCQTARAARERGFKIETELELQPADAARVLGISVEELLALGDRIPSVTKRRPRSPSRIRLYRLSDVRAFAESAKKAA